MLCCLYFSWLIRFGSGDHLNSKSFRRMRWACVGIQHTLEWNGCHIHIYSNIYSIYSNVACSPPGQQMAVWLNKTHLKVFYFGCPSVPPPQVTQLTGFSDPVYAEAYVHVNQYDIVLDVLVVNQTSDTLQNCTLELATLGTVSVYQSICLCVRSFIPCVVEYKTEVLCWSCRWPEAGGEAVSSYSRSSWLCQHQGQRQSGFHRKRHHLREYRWGDVHCVQYTCPRQEVSYL